MMFKATVVAALAAAVQAQGQSLVQLLGATPDLSQLTALVQSQPALLQALGSASNITILAPSNAALGKLLNSSAAAALTSNPGAVAALLTYHVLNGTYPASAVTSKAAFIPSLLTNTSYANVTGGQRVEAVLAGSNVTFYTGNGANSTVTTANQNFTGGVVHIINNVLTIPGKASELLVTGGLTSAYGALQKANLLNAVNGLRDVTIFAPANSAFQAIGSALANISNTDLASVLTYHVVNSTRPYYSTDLATNGTFKTLNGANVTVSNRNGTVYVNGAKVIKPDVLIAGGVVHVIDNILNPANATASGVAFAGASSVSEAPFTSGVPTATTTLGGAAATGSSGSSSSSSSKAAAAPMRTGVVGAAALFGAGAMLANL